MNAGVAVPVALVVALIALIIYYDFETGGDAEPPPYLGELGTPVRGTFVPPTPGPRPTGTARPRPTFVAGARGTPAERDTQRRADLLVIVAALEELRAERGRYIDTRGNTQTLCTFGQDLGCALEPVLGRKVPVDPLGGSNGYWYQSNGQQAAVFASMEEEPPAEQRCESDWEQLQDREYLICVRLPAP